MNLDPRPQIDAYLSRLTARERILLGVMAVTVVLLGLYQFVWLSLSDGRQQLQTRIARREKDIVKMQQQRDTLLDLKRRIKANESAIAKPDENFNLFGYVQTTVAGAVSREKIASMNPSTKDLTPQFQEERVDIKLQQVSLEQILKLLHKVEKGERALRFSRLQIKKRRDDEFSFDVTATVSLLKAVTPAEGEA